MRATKRQTEAIRAYVADQAHEKVVHLEKAASELVGPVRHDIWDVHCPDSRWWVITEPTNLYSREDFKSRDVALTFHIGLALRVFYLHDRKVPVNPGPAYCYPAPGGDGSKRSKPTSQATRQRTSRRSAYSSGSAWSPSSAKRPTTIWCQQARRLQSSAARAEPPPLRGLRIVSTLWRTCDSCGWVDEEYEPPEPPVRRRRRHPKGDCVLTSDISTFMTPEDVI